MPRSFGVLPLYLAAPLPLLFQASGRKVDGGVVESGTEHGELTLQRSLSPGAYWVRVELGHGTHHTVPIRVLRR